MRIYLLWMAVAGLALYAWRNWFVSACALVLLSVVMQREDFPQYLMGINGLNPWNLLFLVTVLAWWVQRRGTGVRLDLPRPVVALLVIALLLLFVTYLRAACDLGSIRLDEEGSERPGLLGFTGEFLINRIKFVVTALMIFDGCRTRKRIMIAAGVILISACAYALMVIKHVPVSSLLSSSESVFMGYRHRIDRDIGLMAIDMSMLLAASFWALVTFSCLAVKRRLVQVGLFAAAAVVFLGMALCHSRGSYLGFAAGGLVLAIARWRKLLWVLPVGVAAIFMFFPAIPARLGMGLAESNYAGTDVQDWDRITAGRSTDLWPPALDQFAKGPAVGFGGMACSRTQLHDEWLRRGDAPRHPHNAYLELLLDMGIVGFFPMMLLYGGIFFLTLKLFRNRQDNLTAAVGGMGLACITVLMVTALGCQSFYPTQSTLLCWCIWGLALRMAVAQQSVRQAGVAGYGLPAAYRTHSYPPGIPSALGAWHAPRARRGG